MEVSTGRIIKGLVPSGMKSWVICTTFPGKESQLAEVLSRVKGNIKWVIKEVIKINYSIITSYRGKKWSRLSLYFFPCGVVSSSFFALVIWNNAHWWCWTSQYRLPDTRTAPKIWYMTVEQELKALRLSPVGQRICFSYMKDSCISFYFISPSFMFLVSFKI